jgi:NAD(P)-dependent dehydrogenase (short-subunit alcohol dehydrogenase family)
MKTSQGDFLLVQMKKKIMSSVVITGSTRGIGFGLADSFLDRGCSVVISGRSEERIALASDALMKKYSAELVFGFPCDVRDLGQVQALWDYAKSRFGNIDIWVNNAGLSGSQMEIWQSPPIQVKEVVETNLVGTIFGSQVAVRGLLEQGHGSLYNMEGIGSDGRMHEGLILYGMTKYGVTYFTKGLIEETKDTSLIIGSIRPGMVVTEFITDQYKGRPEEWERAKRVFNIIASRIEEVTPWLVERILENEKSGVCISYLSPGKLLLRFLSVPFKKRTLFENSTDI